MINATCRNRLRSRRRPAWKTRAAGPFVNLYGCEIGDDTGIGAFVEIQRGAKVGARCKISSHSFVCAGVTIEDEVFIGHGVIFINDRYPRAAPDGSLKNDNDWHLERTLIRRGASIGSGAVIMCGVKVGKDALVGAGAVVTRDVPAGAMVQVIPRSCAAPLIALKQRDLQCQ